MRNVVWIAPLAADALALHRSRRPENVVALEYLLVSSLLCPLSLLPLGPRLGMLVGSLWSPSCIGTGFSYCYIYIYIYIYIYTHIYLLQYLFNLFTYTDILH